MKKASDLSEAFPSLATWVMMTVMTPMMTIGLCNKRIQFSADNDQSDQCDNDTGNLFHWNSG